MADELRCLTARAEIQDLLCRYCRGIDRADADLVKSVYHPGATDNHGIYNGDAAQMVDRVLPMLADTCLRTQHQLSNVIIEVDSDREHARSESYVTAYHLEHAPDPETGRPRMVVFGGRYVDVWERRDGRWGIVTRDVVHDWSDAYPVTLHPNVDDLPQGAPLHQNDCSARVFPPGWGHAAPL